MANPRMELLSRAPLLSELDPTTLGELATSQLLSSWRRGEQVVAARSHGNHLYVVVEGHIELLGPARGGTQARVLREVRPGELFGEEALFRPDRMYTTSALARVDSSVVELPAALVRRALERAGRQGALQDARERWRRRHHLDVLEGSGFFAGLSAAERAQVEQEARAVELRPGELLYHEGDAAETFYVVAAGMLKLSRQVGGMEHIRAWLTDGDVLGDLELRHGSPRLLSAAATGPVELLAIPGPLLLRLIERHPGLGEQVSRLTREGMTRAQRAGQADLLAHSHRLEVGRSTMVIDLSRCVRCGTCAWSCEQTHGISRLVRRGELLTPRPEAPPLLLPTSCQHCTDAACMAGCPTGAIGSEVGGEIFVRASACIGCGDCAKRCPWGNISLAPRPGGGEVAVKCDNCKDHKVSACAHNCPTGALRRVEARTLLEGAAAGPDQDRGELAPLLWLLLPLVLPVAASLASPAGLSGGTSLGVALGVGALVAMAATALYSPRRRGIARVMAWERRPPGEVGMDKAPRPATVALRHWLPAHIGLGGAAMVMAALHAGGWPRSLAGAALLVSLGLVLVTGLAGLLLYRAVPPLLTAVEGSPWLVEDLQARRRELSEELADLCLERPPAFTTALEEIAGELATWRWVQRVLIARQGELAFAREVGRSCAPKVQEMGAAHRAALGRAIEIQALRAHLGLQHLLHRALRAWLPPHILAAVVLLGALGLHLIQVIIY